ncbi:MAG TPA: hypothetical protein VGI75_14675 [Pirellulales bacterium]
MATRKKILGWWRQSRRVGSPFLIAIFVAASLIVDLIRPIYSVAEDDRHTIAIEGIVVDATRQPAAGVSVSLFHGATIPGDAAPETSTTNQKGQYHFTIPADQNWITLIADDPLGDRQGYANPGLADELPAPIPPIKLKPARHTLVKVVDAQGSPVAGATVTAPDCRRYLGDQLLTAKTNASGVVRLRYTEDAFVHQVVAFKSGIGLDYFVFPMKSPGDILQTGDCEEAELGDPLPDAIILRLVGARTLRIKSADADNHRVPGVRFYPSQLTTSAKPYRLFSMRSAIAMGAITDASGTATFDWLPQNFVGEIKFNGGGPPASTIVSRLETEEQLTLYAQKPVDEMTVPLYGPVKLSGHVYDSDGKPAAGITVVAELAGKNWFPQQCNTAPDGSYCVTVEGAKNWLIGIQNDRWSAPNQSIALTSSPIYENVDFKLTEGTVIRGTIYQLPDRTGISNIGILLDSDVMRPPKGLDKIFDRQHSFGPSTFRRKTATDFDGHYQFCVPLGSYAIQFGVKNHAGSNESALDTSSKREIVKDFELPHVETERFTCRVVDVNDQPVVNRLVSGVGTKPFDMGEGQFRSTTVDNGSFIVDRPLASGIAVIWNTEKNGVVKSNAPLLAAASIAAKQKDVVIKELPLVNVTGRLVDGHGKPVTYGHIRYQIKVLTREGAFEPLRSGEDMVPAGDGSYTFSYVIPGIEYGIYYREYNELRAENLPVLIKSFITESGQALDLGDTPVPVPGS